MRAMAVHALIAKFATTMKAAARQSDFACGDCERSARCGLPPSAQCIARVQQLARDDWKWRRRNRALTRMIY